MTLDEMIKWLEARACDALWHAGALDAYTWAQPTGHFREHAATLLTIENALRAVRDGVAA